MAILDVQAVVRRPQEALESRYAVEDRARNRAGKENSFNRHLKKMSQRDDEPQSPSSTKGEIDHTSTALERKALEKRANSVDPGNEEAANQITEQEKQISKSESDSDGGDSTENNQPVIAIVGVVFEPPIPEAQINNEEEAGAATLIANNTNTVLEQPNAELNTNIIIPEVSVEVKPSTESIAKSDGETIVEEAEILKTIPVLSTNEPANNEPANNESANNESANNKPANNEPVLQNELLEGKGLRSLSKVEVNISAGNGDKGNKKDNDTDKKPLTKLGVLEKLILDQTDKKSEQPEKTDIKKIIDIASQRQSTKKESPELIIEDTVLNESADNQPQPVANLDKAFGGITRLGLDPEKAFIESSVQSAASDEEIIDQIVKKVELFNKQVGSEMKIQLKPEFLGKMIIHISIDDGMVTARFSTESQHMKQVLEANMNSLKQTLEANGLKVEKTEVNVQLDNGGNFNNSSEGNRQQRWQEMVSQGRNNGRYNSLPTAFAGEVEKRTAYQQETDVLQVFEEGRVDFVV